MINIPEIEQIFHDANVLFVEDDELVRKMSLPLYRKIFGNVDIARNGEEGLELFRENHYDIVMTDYSMPKMNGCEMLENILKITPHVLTIVLTALESRAKTKKERIDLFLNKPFLFTDFLEGLLSVKEKYLSIKQVKG